MSTTQLSEQTLLIGGRWRGAGPGEVFEQVDPYGSGWWLVGRGGRTRSRA
jgi:hypothetical protein